MSGSQLDPIVVETFVEMIEQRRVSFQHADHADFELELNSSGGWRTTRAPALPRPA